MQERVKTSFIPKASFKQERIKRPSGGSLSLVNLIATLILIIAVVATLGIFLFEQFTAQNIERKRESLERARAAFEPATIKELSRLDTRLKTGQQLLGAHMAPSYLFDEIESLTLDAVRFKDFSYSETAPGRFVVTMGGEARSFNALALQSDAIGASDFFTEPIFQNLNLNANGNVVFSFIGTVDLGSVRYRTRTNTASSVPLNESNGGAGSDNEEVTQ